MNVIFHSRPLNQSPLTRQSKGFTLVELVVVVVVLTVFAGMMTLSVGSTESRKNRAFYEHLIDSLEYVRLVSAERMQPMGLVLQADKQGQTKPVIVSLSNPYAHLEASSASQDNRQDSKNIMELSAMSADPNRSIKPSWEVDDEIRLPELPPKVTIEIIPLDAGLTNTAMTLSGAQPQPWFVGVNVPKAVWFGTGEAAPVRIEVRHDKRLVGDAILLQEDGRIAIEGR